jgi:hypothetical protein
MPKRYQLACFPVLHNPNYYRIAHHSAHVCEMFCKQVSERRQEFTQRSGEADGMAAAVVSSRKYFLQISRTDWRITTIFLTLLLGCSGLLAAQNAKTSDLQFHKFLPKVAPEQVVGANASQAGASGTRIGMIAAQQIQALQQEKASRTPAQRKIDSNILYTTRMLAGQAAAPGVSYLYTGIELDSSDGIVVDMVANVTESLLNQLNSAGASVLHTNRKLRSIRAVIPPQQVENIAASPDVIFISPRAESIGHGDFQLAQGVVSASRGLAFGFERRAATVRGRMATALTSSATPGTPQIGQGSVETEGDVTHRALDARGAFGVDGTGLKIGVLSDGVTHLAASQATEDLPPTCGTPPCLTVLTGQAGAGDEGTAMLEIIHDMAPGASLYFATADNGITSFAQNIRDLRTAGCDIIVDDVFY